MKRRIYEILEVGELADRTSRIFDIFILVLISLNVICVVLESIRPLEAQWRAWFRAFEVFSVAVFTIEYILRLWSCTENEAYQRPVLGRLRFIISPLATIDLMAILPFYLATAVDLRFARAVRLFRLFRVAKVSRYSSVLSTFGRVLNAKKEELFTMLSFILLLLLFASTIMYFVENQAQPEAFSSIPAAMWWGVSTLTTVGYGDTYPITPLGKLIASAISILGIGLFALPAGILGSAFVDDMQKAKKSAKSCPHCGGKLGPLTQ